MRWRGRHDKRRSHLRSKRLSRARGRKAQGLVPWPSVRIVAVNDPAAPLDPVGDPLDASEGHLWPSPDYARQLEALRAAVGETVFIAELELTDVQLSARLTDKP